MFLLISANLVLLGAKEPKPIEILTQATNPRLGQKSPAAVLPQDMLKYIGQLAKSTLAEYGQPRR